MAEKPAKQGKKHHKAKTPLSILLHVIIYIVVIYGAVCFTKEAYQFSYQIFGDVSVESEPGNDVMITIRSGETTKELAEFLEYKNVIKDRNAFFIRAKLMVNDQDPILPGVYKLNTSMNYGEIIEMITNPNENLDEN